jgi:CRP-like cAMP-binding protein
MQQSPSARLVRLNGNGQRRDPRWLESVISNLPVFRQTSQRHVAGIATYCRAQAVRRGALLCGRGDALPGVMALAYGFVKLALPRTEGDERVVRFVGASETFGEAAALLDRPSPVDAVALADSMVVVIPPRPLLELLELDPNFARSMVCSLAERSLELLTELEASVRQRSVQRLADYLGSLVRRRTDPGVCAVRLPATKTAIAARLGVTRETLSRLLRELATRGLIEVARNEIMIFDRARLAELAGGSNGSGSAA